MENVPLYTRDGRLVTHVPVPPFHPPAELIIWGARFFVRRTDGRYCEGMPWHVPPAVRPLAPGDPDDDPGQRVAPL